MISERDKQFIKYWEENRLRKKKVWRNLSVGLPLGVGLVSAIMINLFWGWFQRADMTLRADHSGSLVLIIAFLLIVVFIVIFGAKYRWDMNEQHYKELLSRMNKDQNP